MANTYKQLQSLRAKQVKLLQQVGKDLAKAISKLAADHLAGLSTEDVAAVLSNSAVKSALGNIGSTKVQVPKSKPAKAKVGGAKRGRKSKVTDEQIMEFLKTEKTVGEIAKKLGQLIPKRVAAMEKAGKVTLRKEGLKKFYIAK